MAALRFWELSGGYPVLWVLRKSFSSAPTGGNGKPCRYYRCPNRAVNGLEACQMKTNYRAEKIEAQIWETVSTYSQTAGMAPEALVSHTRRAPPRLQDVEAQSHRPPQRLRGPDRRLGTCLRRW